MYQLRACFGLAVLVAVVAPCDVLTNDGNFDTPGVHRLAKAGNWRDGLNQALVNVGRSPFAIVEIASDRPTAELAWRENVPDTLSAGSEDGYGPGVYGRLADVDFEKQAIVVWSSGESGSCPTGTVDMRTTEDGTVEVQTIDRESSEVAISDPDIRIPCTADYVFYRMVLAVDRERLPDLGSLPSENIVGVPDGIVTVYPYEPPGFGY